LAIYDVRGALVHELLSGTVSAGTQRVVWDGSDAHGKEVGSGVYFCRLEAGELSETKRMVLLR
jgi:flagellar hook assembly protein FlgD